jgi:Protein of unknown function (DUF2845)
MRCRSREAARFVAVGLGLLCALLSAAAHAEGMYCGSRLISRGDTLFQVRSVCGVPDDAQRRVETRTERRRVRVACARAQNPSGQCERTVEQSTDVVVDDWTYDLGRQRFIRFLTFVDGRLATVQTGGYGSRDDR